METCAFGAFARQKHRQAPFIADKSLIHLPEPIANNRLLQQHRYARQ
jgi:hypothetical protein